MQGTTRAHNTRESVAEIHKQNPNNAWRYSDKQLCCFMGTI